MTATTALTAQNTLGVSDIHHVPPAFIAKQIDACIDDIGVDVVKIGMPLLKYHRFHPRLVHLVVDLTVISAVIGMLASAETIDVVADALERHGRPLCVLDPVAISSHPFPCPSLIDTGHGLDKRRAAPPQRRHQHSHTPIAAPHNHPHPKRP